MRSRAHLNALPGQPKKATPLLPALHARADGAAIDAAFDAEAAVLAEWLVSKPGSTDDLVVVSVP